MTHVLTLACIRVRTCVCVGGGGGVCVRSCVRACASTATISPRRYRWCVQRCQMLTSFPIIDILSFPVCFCRLCWRTSHTSTGITSSKKAEELYPCYSGEEDEGMSSFMLGLLHQSAVSFVALFSPDKITSSKCS